MVQNSCSYCETISQYDNALAFVITNGSKEAAVAAATPPPHPPPPNSILQTLPATLPIRCVIIATTRSVYTNAYQLTLSFVNLPNPSQTTQARVRDPHPGLTRSLSSPYTRLAFVCDRRLGRSNPPSITIISL
jgi:hypothetical protein